MLVGSNPPKGEDFFTGRNLRRAMDVCVCLLGLTVGCWKEDQHSFGHHREVSTGSSPSGKGAHGCINVVVYVCECEVEWAWVAGESAPEPRRITK
jgi:hypothetical protein